MTIQKGLSNEFGVVSPELAGVTQTVGSLDAAPFSFCIVASRFNNELTAGLAKAAVSTLIHHGARADAIRIVWVPGAFEIPTLLEECAAQQREHALIALGAVLEGDTPHAAAINAAVSRSLNEIARTYKLPVIDGVVVARTMEQAETRCLGEDGGRGAYAAQAAIEMANVIKALRE